MSMNLSKGMGPLSAIDRRIVSFTGQGWIARGGRASWEARDMKCGISIFPTDQTLQPVALARSVEAHGFESLWFPEHSHIPISRATPWGGREGAPPLPERYWRTHDQFVALAAAAAVTERIKLCTGITLVAQRDPIWLAKEVASLDMISRGRVIFGVGYGWNREEMASHGVTYGKRRELLREKILMMRALWASNKVSYDGELLRLEPSWAWPKPVQKPHPPIVLGAGIGPKMLAHLVEFADGWMPLGRHEAGADAISAIREALERAGRDTTGFELTYWGARPEDLTRLDELGYDRAVFTIDSDPPEAVEKRLDELAALLT